LSVGGERPAVRAHLLLAAALAAVLCGVAVAAGAVGGPGAGSPAAATAPASDQLVAPDEGSDRVWPYTSRRQSVTGRTLALNVVVHGDDERVRRLLTDRTEANWSADPNVTVVDPPWRPAHGSTRYTYITPDRNATGWWVAPDYQIAVGTYFGQRTHVRAYAGPAGDWTAIQAHTEYWDWFRLRHTVTGVAAGARFVEDDLQDERGVENISRVEHGLTGGGSDGRWTVVDLMPATLVGAVAVPLVARRRAAEDRRVPADALLLPAALLGVVLGVRAWGLAAEAVAPGVSPKPFAAVGYLALVVGPPAVVATLARDRPARRAALLAAAGLGLGVTVDMALVGVDRAPERLLVHRGGVVAALALFAAGVGRGDRRVVAAGAVAWCLALAAPLLGLLYVAR
jgi:hypothetical protein